MELVLTHQQTKYLNTHGPIKAEVLQRIYKKSVADQEAMLKQAQKIRLKPPSKKK